MSTCGQVLEKCPNKCEAFVQRKDMEDHLLHCRKRLKQNDSSASKNRDVSDVRLSFDNDTSDVRLSLMEENLVHLREQLNSEIQMRHQLIADLGGLKKRNQV